MRVGREEVGGGGAGRRRGREGNFDWARKEYFKKRKHSSLSRCCHNWI